MSRIAFFGLLNPTPSGISDYNEELLPLLRKFHQIDVFVDYPSHGVDVYDHRKFSLIEKRNPYDLILYQMGNSLLHEYMYGYLFQNPGVVIFHDYCLHHSRAKMLLLKGMLTEYVEEAKWMYPDEESLTKVLAGGMGGDLFQYYFPFVELILRSSLAAGAHTDYVVEQLRNGGTPVIKIPMAVKIEKEAVALPDPYPGKIVLASFGLVTPEKRYESILTALSQLRTHYPNLYYVIVGEIGAHYRIQEEVDFWRVSDCVELTGRVDLSTFHRLMNRADIILNLRHPSAREMSATLLRALAYGKPVLISRLKHLQEIPSNAVFRVHPDNEIEDLFHQLWPLIESPTLRKRHGENARKYIHEHHRTEQMLTAYQQLIEQGLSRKNSFRRPELPLHLSSAKKIMRTYISQTAFGGENSELMDWIL